jgi:hypothetical protein
MFAPMAGHAACPVRWPGGDPLGKALVVGAGWAQVEAMAFLAYAIGSARGAAQVRTFSSGAQVLRRLAWKSNSAGARLRAVGSSTRKDDHEHHHRAG